LYIYFSQLPLHRMKKLLLFCFLLGSLSADAWNPYKKDPIWNYKGIGYRVGYGYQRGHHIELGMFRYYTDYNVKPYGVIGYYSWGGGGEIELAKNPNYTVKCYFEATRVFIGGRLNMSYTKNFRSSAFIVTPELGISVVGIVYCYFGYAAPVYKMGADKFNGFRISIGFSLVDYLF
jgi:hypothetical protein